MAEIKILESLDEEVASFKSTGNALNDTYKSVTSSQVKTLETATGYIKQHADIKVIIDLYKALVAKDAKDMENMITEFRNRDRELAEMTRVR